MLDRCINVWTFCPIIFRSKLRIRQHFEKDIRTFFTRLIKNILDILCISWGKWQLIQKWRKLTFVRFQTKLKMLRGRKFGGAPRELCEQLHIWLKEPYGELPELELKINDFAKVFARCLPSKPDLYKILSFCGSFHTRGGLVSAHCWLYKSFGILLALYRAIFFLFRVKITKIRSNVYGTE